MCSWCPAAAGVNENPSSFTKWQSRTIWPAVKFLLLTFVGFAESDFMLKEKKDEDPSIDDGP